AKLRQELIDRRLLGGTGDRPAEVPHCGIGTQHAADRRVDLWPCGTFTARQRIVQPQAVVQPENRRLADRACGSAADRLVRVAFELDRTAVPHLYQQPAAGSATGTRR